MELLIWLEKLYRKKWHSSWLLIKLWRRRAVLRLIRTVSGEKISRIIEIGLRSARWTKPFMLLIRISGRKKMWSWSTITQLSFNTTLATSKKARHCSALSTELSKISRYSINLLKKSRSHGYINISIACWTIWGWFRLKSCRFFEG